MPPDYCHEWATQFLQCKSELNIPSPSENSPIPYYLLCHAIELEIKSRLSKTIAWKTLKNEYGHNLIKLYDKLELSDQLLDSKEKEELKKANIVYMNKGFEYILPFDKVTKNKRYPQLELLDFIAKKMIKP
ncbi:MAG: hypothetical protein A2Z15_02835 [Chloroflexi bacterium RBG_16_50_11]|nr:MAG: hypothetical protein A2Z15_02835 [Chloroflexi bacterium RBG_16_50_11]